MLAFGPDGYLYIGVGDGGSGNDPPNNAQNVNVLLGKILELISTRRRDPVSSTSRRRPTPSTAPPRVATRSFAFGMRNPWRFSFDRLTGQQWVADVGQSTREEVDTPIVAGGDYGWRVYEGFWCTNNDPTLCNPSNYIPPILDYSHTNGRCSITGRIRVPGIANALPNGTYIYADYCSGRYLAWDGSTQSLAGHDDEHLLIRRG